MRTDRPLCLLANCAIPNRHRDDCDGNCRGCLPGMAADGLRLCQHHADRIGRDARDAANLYLDLETPGRASGDGDHVSGDPEAPIPINPAAVDARANIRATLVAWCRMISEERGIQLPADAIQAIGGYLVRHHLWLAAHPAAAEASDEIAQAARTGRGIAYPSGTRTFDVAPCPEMVDGEPCPGRVVAVMRAKDNLLPSLLACNADADHVWPATEWRRFGRAVKAAA